LIRGIALGDRGPTVLFDSVGGDVGRGLFELLAPGGRMIVFGWSSGTPTPVEMGDIVGRMVTVSSALGPHRLAKSGGLKPLETRALAEVAAGRLTPAVHTFKLADAAEAHRALEERATTGKVVMIP
jgi:NADPH:quinone reductase